MSRLLAVVAAFGAMWAVATYAAILCQKKVSGVVVVRTAVRKRNCRSTSRSSVLKGNPALREHQAFQARRDGAERITATDTRLRAAVCVRVAYR